MPGWGQGTARGAGTTGEIERAHQMLDELKVPGGNLAARTCALVEQLQKPLIEVTSMSEAEPRYLPGSLPVT